MTDRYLLQVCTVCIIALFNSFGVVPRSAGKKTVWSVRGPIHVRISIGLVSSNQAEWGVNTRMRRQITDTRSQVHKPEYCISCRTV